VEVETDTVGSSSEVCGGQAWLAGEGHQLTSSKKCSQLLCSRFKYGIFSDAIFTISILFPSRAMGGYFSIFLSWSVQSPNSLRMGSMSIYTK
jgi:hypothetical protein